jgi:uncharacterized protein YqhQ
MTTLPTTFDPRKAFAFASRASAVVGVASVLAGHLLTILYWHLVAQVTSANTLPPTLFQRFETLVATTLYMLFYFVFLVAWMRSIKTVIDIARDGGGVVTILRALFLGQVPARRFAK